MTDKEIRKMVTDLEYDYDNEHITFFVEINDEDSNQICQFGEFDSPFKLLEFMNDFCMFADNENYDVWLMYEVEDSDIDRFADLVYGTNGWRIEA